MGWRRGLSALVAFLVMSVVPACSASPAQAGDSGGECAWGFVMSPTFNVIWPETSAIFWTTLVPILPGMRIEVAGSFPESRYMSVKTYSGNAILDSLADNMIAPDEGSSNPFVDREAPTDPEQRRYTVSIQPGVQVEDGDNELAAVVDGGTAGLAIVNYRVYLPDDPEDFTGGVGLPELKISYFGGRVQKTLPPCPQALPGPDAAPSPEALEASENLARLADILAQGSGSQEGTSTPIVFTRNEASQFWPNPDDAYLVGPAKAESGRVAVVRAKAASFPDTRGGAHVTDPHDLRYWSMCVHMLRFPLPTADCAADFETVLDQDGYYTYVVSMPYDRPSNAVPEQGVTWLPWGEPFTDVALTLRNMLPDEGFPHSIQDTEPGTEASVMGEYYPVGAMCSRQTFEAGGADACLAEAQ